MNSNDLIEYVTVPEAAEAAGVSPATLHRWISAGKLPAAKLVGRLRVRICDVQALLVPVVPRRQAEPARAPPAAETERILDRLWPHRRR